MTIVPAIDLRGGRCVRLRHGDPEQQTAYDEDPVARARSFVRAGATQLHVVDLDGALGTGENLGALRAICAAVDVPVQTGGGIRSEEDVEQRFGFGVQVVVLGTMLVEQPALGRTIVATYGERIVAGVDARGDALAIRGWQATGVLSRDAFVREVATWGIGRIVFTEIGRDGAGTGYDLAALAHVAALTPMRVTASGGAKTLADLGALARAAPDNLDSAIVGRALYEGTVDLREAIATFTGA